MSQQPWRGALKIVELICCQKELDASRAWSSHSAGSSQAGGQASEGAAPRVLSLNLQTGVLSAWDSSRERRVQEDLFMPGWP